MPYSLILDILVAVLLAVTIGYAVVLNKRLGKLRGDKKNLEKLAAKFGESTSRAEESIEKLRHTADLLQGGIDKAQTLKDDLSFLIDRGDQAADSLEDLVRLARDISGVGPRPGAGASVDASASANGSAGGFIDASDQPADAPNQRGDGGARSQAEQELLKAIRSAG